MPHLVAAPDKFRGTASAAQVAAAMARGAARSGWSADEVPMSDGGEGLLDALGSLGGERHVTTVVGPLGAPVEAEWALFDRIGHGSGRPHQDAPPPGPTAVIEMARASGRALLPEPVGDQPVRASTTGVGQLVLAARDAGARRIIVGCGGSATTDGGLGAFEAVGSPAALHSVELIVACDVPALPFLEAARAFGPQKGATTAQVELLSARLESVAARYLDETGVDVTAVRGAGATGGLAGGLVALGGRIEPGFELVASLTGLADRIAIADLVATGEGHLDPPSLEGKVPGGVLRLARAAARRRDGRSVPVLCVVGDADPALVSTPPTGMEIVSLTTRFGSRRSRHETTALVEVVTSEVISRATSADGTTGRRRRRT